jgi:hypothetical protein
MRFSRFFSLVSLTRSFHGIGLHFQITKASGLTNVERLNWDALRILDNKINGFAIKIVLLS